MVIRKAKLSDAQRLLPLLEQLGYTALDKGGIESKIRQYSEDQNSLLVYELDDSIAAFISLHIFPIFHSPGNAGRITAFCVHENHRAKGIGLAMLQAAENFFRSNGCSRVEVTSNNRRTSAHSFYLNHGYVEDSRKFVKYFR